MDQLINPFRIALHAHLAGRLDLAGLEREMVARLVQGPGVAPTFTAIIDARHRAGQIPDAHYRQLIAAIRQVVHPQPLADSESALDDAPRARPPTPVCDALSVPVLKAAEARAHPSPQVSWPAQPRACVQPVSSPTVSLSASPIGSAVPEDSAWLPVDSASPPLRAERRPSNAAAAEHSDSDLALALGGAVGAAAGFEAPRRRNVPRNFAPAPKSMLARLGIGVGVVASVAIGAAISLRLLVAESSSHSTSIDRVVPVLEALPAPVRSSILTGRARDALLARFSVRIDQTAAAEGRHGDAAATRALLSQLNELLPDSKAVARLSRRVKERGSGAEGESAPGRAATGSEVSAASAQLAEAKGADTKGVAPSDTGILTAGSVQSTPPVLPAGAGSSVDQARSADSLTEPPADSVPVPQIQANARAPRDEERQLQRSLIEIERLKQKLLAQAAADDVDAALDTLDALQVRLSPDDPFIHDARTEIAQAYVDLAEAADRDGRIEDARALVQRAAQLGPDLARVKYSLAKYRSSPRAAAASNERQSR